MNEAKRNDLEGVQSPFAVFLTSNPEEPELLDADPSLDKATLGKMREHARNRIADAPSTRKLAMVIVSLEQVMDEDPGVR